jgi:hypothetical protein
MTGFCVSPLSFLHATTQVSAIAITNNLIFITLEVVYYTKIGQKRCFRKLKVTGEKAQGTRYKEGSRIKSKEERQ